MPRRFVRRPRPGPPGSPGASGGGGATGPTGPPGAPGPADLTPFTTDDLVEGGSRLYLTNERIDDRVAALLVAGTGITLTYNDPANTLTIDASSGGGGSAIYVDNEVPTITPGLSAFVLANVPTTGAEHLYRRGKRLLRVASGPGVDEYTIAGLAVTTGWTLLSTDVDEIIADYHYAGAGPTFTPVDNEQLSVTPGTTTLVLATVPTTTSEHLYRRGKRLLRVSSSPGVDEYTISADTVTTGWTLLTTDVGELWADYRY